jgi:hypothetical protein
MNESEIKKQFEYIVGFLDGQGVPTHQGLAELSLFGRVTEALATATARAEAAEAELGRWKLWCHSWVFGGPAEWPGATGTVDPRKQVDDVGAALADAEAQAAIAAAALQANIAQSNATAEALLDERKAREAAEADAEAANRKNSELIRVGFATFARAKAAEADTEKWKATASDMQILAERLAATLGVIESICKIPFNNKENLAQALSSIEEITAAVVSAWDMSLDDVLTQTQRIEAALAAHDATKGGE